MLPFTDLKGQSNHLWHSLF